VAKAIATVALLDKLPADGASLLEGRAFRDLGIVGAVESDFFDWPLLDPKGGDLVMRIARHANRFRLHDIEVDVLKGLYESLIDPEQRHDLGEYYTPDWLAERMCETAIRDPLNERVIDPACGSGTFLFHSIRRFVRAAGDAKMSPGNTVEQAAERIAGIDIHPVAVIFARVTYLLALMPTLQKGRPRSVSVPVYLGDALQWNAREFMNQRDLEIVVPAPKEATNPLGPSTNIEEEEKRVILRFPARVAEHPGQLDATLDQMLGLAERNQPVTALQGWLARQPVEKGADADMLATTYEALCALQKQGRNHIWGYVARNLSRPIWLASEAQKADVVIGNPPWLSYRGMSKATKNRFKDEMIKAGLWVGGKSATAQDLSGYFFARAVYLYMRRSGHIAFVMPYAAMTREPYKAFRTGRFKEHGYTEAQVRFTAAWAFPSDVQPLFPVPSCVLFGERAQLPNGLPKQVKVFSGVLPRRDAHRDEATKALRESLEPWPTDDGERRVSAYRERFRQDATLVPRRFMIVELVESGRLGRNPQAPVVRGRTSNQDKRPWNAISPLEGAVETEFLRVVYLGESIAPFRVLQPVLGVIPWSQESQQVMDGAMARTRGHSRLADWLENAEAIWKEHGKRTMNFRAHLDYYGKLSSQFPIPKYRLLYAASGTNPAAVVLGENDLGIVEHGLYWAGFETCDVAYYHCAMLNV
jgi:hypothetical protein